MNHVVPGETVTLPAYVFSFELTVKSMSDFLKFFRSFFLIAW